MGIVRISRTFFGLILLASMGVSWTGDTTIGICQAAWAQSSPVASDPQGGEGEKIFESLVQTVFTLDMDVNARVYDCFLEVLGAAPRGEDDMVKQIPLENGTIFKNFMVRRFKGKEGAEIILVDGNKDDEAGYLFLTNEKAEFIKCLYKVREEEDGRPVPDEVARERFAKERDWWLGWEQNYKRRLDEVDKDQ